MKTKQLFIGLLFILLLSRCTAVREGVRARKLLGNCSYELVDITINELDFSPVIKFDQSAKKINIDNINPEELILLADNIRKKEFKLELNKLSINSSIRIHNPNNEEVKLDSILLNCHLDEQYLLTLHHKKHLRIYPDSSNITVIGINFPSQLNFSQIEGTNNIILEGTMWIRMDIGNTHITLPLPFNVQSDKVKKLIEKHVVNEKERIAKTLLSQLKNTPQKKTIKKKLNTLFGL